jgi:hypothetical protein
MSNVFDLLVFTDWDMRSLVAFSSFFCFFYNAPESIVSFHYDGVFAAFSAVALDVPGRRTNFAAERTV